MKTTYKIVAILLSCFLLIGCTPADSETVDEDPRRAPMGTRCDTYDAYLSYLEKTALPSDFVHYDDIRHFGSLNYFYGEIGAPLTENISYTYSVIDASGRNITYRATEGKELNLYNAVILAEDDINPADMRNVNTNHDLCVYIIHGIHYVYGIDKLMYIAWHNNNTKYVLMQSSSNLYYHPLDDTGIGQLLNIEGKSKAELMRLLGMNA